MKYCEFGQNKIHTGIASPNKVDRALNLYVEVDEKGVRQLLLVSLRPIRDKISALEGVPFNDHLVSLPTNQI